MASKQLFMESTEVDPMRTAGEITALLVQSGARHINQQYDEKQKLTGLSFTLEIFPGVVRGYKLPVKTDPIFKILQKKRNYPPDYKEKDRERAERIAWRQLFRWIQAQIAMIQVGMVEAGEIFLPYVQDESGTTLYQHFLAEAQKLLPASGETK